MRRRSHACRVRQTCADNVNPIGAEARTLTQRTCDERAHGSA